MKKIKKLNFIKFFDLQNSSRTNFYKRILFSSNDPKLWSSSDTTLPSGSSKEDFDKDPVLKRFDHQLKTSGLITKHTLTPDFSWSCTDISNLRDKYDLDKYIVIFPFCSPHLFIKKWPNYNNLIKLIKSKYNNKYKIVTAPGPTEIKDSKEFDAVTILDNGKSINISQLSSLIKNSSFVIANDTGPAHMAAHLNTTGLTLFGSHTTAEKVSIERENFKAIQVNDLYKLSAEKVFEKLISILK